MRRYWFTEDDLKEIYSSYVETYALLYGPTVPIKEHLFDRMLKIIQIHVMSEVLGELERLETNFDDDDREGWKRR